MVDKEIYRQVAELPPGSRVWVYHQFGGVTGYIITEADGGGKKLQIPGARKGKVFRTGTDLRRILGEPREIQYRREDGNDTGCADREADR